MKRSKNPILNLLLLLPRWTAEQQRELMSEYGKEEPLGTYVVRGLVVAVVVVVLVLLFCR